MSSCWRLGWAVVWTAPTSSNTPSLRASPSSTWSTPPCLAARSKRSRAKREGYSSRALPRLCSDRIRSCSRRFRSVPTKFVGGVEAKRRIECSLDVVDSSSLPASFLHELPADLPSYLLENFAVANQLVKNALRSFGIPQDETVPVCAGCDV